MRHNAITTYSYSTDDETISVVAELAETRLRSLTIKIGGSGRVPAHITPSQLQELSEITQKAATELRSLGVTGLTTPLATDEPNE